MANTFFYTVKDNPKDKINVEIGDSKQLDFYPQQKILRWDNECNVSIRLTDNEIGDENVETIGNKIKWSKGNKEAYFYSNDKESELEIILKNKPDTNIIRFTLRDKDVDYWYQPPLSQKEIDLGAIRPENIVGSYAVYAKTPKTNLVDGKEYKTGKIGHIYRPKIIDSIGTEVWGELHIEDDILTVTIPQDFLDNAVYPVKHAAGLTFGYTTAGASEYTGEDFMLGSLGTPASTGTLTKISAYIYEDNLTNDHHSKCAIYKSSDSTLVGQTSERIGFAQAIQWEDFNAIGTPSVATIEYAVVIWTDDQQDAFFKVGYDISGGPGMKYQILGYAGSFPDPATFTSDAWTMSVYATYTTGGAPALPINNIQMIL